MRRARRAVTLLIATNRSLDFAHFSHGRYRAAQRWLSINSTIGITRLVRNGDRPAPVSQAVIDALKSREDASGIVQLDRRPRFLPGDKIRVMGGAFSDFLGLYEGMSTHERVAILLDMLGRKVRVTVDVDHIEAA